MRFQGLRKPQKPCTKTLVSWTFYVHLQWAGSVTGYGEQPQRKYLWNLPKMSPSILWDHFNQVTYIGACERASGGLTWSFFEFSKAMFLRYLGLVLRLDGSLVVTLHLKVSVITRHVSPQAWSTWWQGNYSLSFKTWSFNASFMNIVLYSFTSTFSQFLPSHVEPICFMIIWYGITLGDAALQNGILTKILLSSHFFGPAAGYWYHHKSPDLPSKGQIVHILTPKELTLAPKKKEPL